MDNFDILCSVSCCKYNDYIYFYSVRLQMLFKINVNSGRVSVVEIPAEISGCRSFYIHNDIFLFFSDYNRSVYELKINQKNRTDIKMSFLPKELLEDGEDRWGEYYIKVEDSLFFYSWESVILQYDLTSGEWRSYRKWYDKLTVEQQQSAHIKKKAFVYNNYIYFPLAGLKKFVTIDLINHKEDIIDMVFYDAPESINQVYMFKNVLYATGSYQDSYYAIYICKNIDSMLFEIISNIDVFKNPSGILIMAVTKEKLFFIPNHFDKAYIFDQNKRDVSELLNIPIVSKDYLGNDWFKNSNYYSECDHYDCYYYFNPWKMILLKIDKESGETDCTDIFISNDTWRIIFNKYWNSKIMIENDFINSGDLIRYIDCSRE